MDIKCPHCGTKYEIDTSEYGRFVKCEACGKGFVAGTARKSQIVVKAVENVLSEEGIKKSAEAVGKKFREFTGTEKLEGFSVGALFADVFKKHTADEIESYFTVGTPNTVPDIEEVDASWPRPWMFLRALIGSGVVYFLFVYAWEWFRNMNLLPGLIMTGAMAIPLATLLFFFEMNARRNVSLYRVVRLVFLGGIVSLIFSSVLFELPLNKLGWMGASIAGLIEEPGKLIALLVVARSARYKYKLNGLLFGACVGTGFAIFESMGYAFGTLLAAGIDDMNSNIMMRGLLSPFGHIVWTAICGAAMWRVKGAAPFTLSMVKDGRFWHLALVPVVLHIIWNADFELPFYGKQLLLGFVAWTIILALIQEGLKEIRAEKEHSEIQ